MRNGTPDRAPLELVPGRPLRLGGAHDALSACLVEQAGFPAVWLSGFGVAAAQFDLPDANLVTLSESAEAARRVAAAVRIPVVVDGDNGFGDAFHAARATREYAAAGAAAVCLEDNAFPKRCSLWASAPRALVPPEEMAAKIAAAKKAAEPYGTLVIGRVESLIAGLGPEDALARARAYAEAGADAILIHARSFPPLGEIARSGRVPRPLVAVPTLYPEVPFSELADAGFAAVVYANQLLRAMVRAGRAALSLLRRAETLSEVEPLISPLEEIHRLVRVPPEWFVEKPQHGGNGHDARNPEPARPNADPRGHHAARR